MSAACRIGASGLRSSCASVARNSSLRRSVSRSATSDTLLLRDVARDLRSTDDRTPSTSLMGETVSDTSMRTPFLPRTVS